MIATLILNTIKIHGGKIDVGLDESLRVVPALACNDQLADLISANKKAVIAAIYTPAGARPKVKGYLIWHPSRNKLNGIARVCHGVWSL